jgi:hypothetical protein
VFYWKWTLSRSIWSFYWFVESLWQIESGSAAIIRTIILKEITNIWITKVTVRKLYLALEHKRLLTGIKLNRIRGNSTNSNCWTIPHKSESSILA